jgi:hypothetical protein
MRHAASVSRACETRRPTLSSGKGGHSARVLSAWLYLDQRRPQCPRFRRLATGHTCGEGALVRPGLDVQRGAQGILDLCSETDRF